MNGLPRYPIAVLIMGLALPSSALTAQGSTATDAEPAERLVVIGTRASVESGMVPVDVISGEDLRQAGAVGDELGEALAILAPSFQFPRQSNSVTSDHIRSATLRGMNPDQVLVLVNGKRRHPSAVVNDNTKIGRGTNAFDFNTIALSSVKRIEILRDGASAQYGSDAIAGVINIVLEDRLQGVQYGASLGAHMSRVDPIDQTLTDGETATGWVRNGHSLGADGWLNYGVELSRRQATNRAGFDRISPFIPQTPANLALAGQRTHRVGDPDTMAINAWINGEVQGAGHSLYGSATFSRRDTEGAGVFRHPETNQNVRELFPDGFGPVTLGENLDAALTFGMRHAVGRWRFDHFAAAGVNRFDFGVRNSLNPTLGTDSPTRFDSGRFRMRQLQLGSEVEREWAIGKADRPLHLVAGIDIRHERFASSAGDPASFTAGDFRFAPDLEALVGRPDIGAQAAKGLGPEDVSERSRMVFGAFVEWTATLNSRTKAVLAGRFEDYQDFGSTFSGKLALNVDVHETLAWRASLSNSFRAPSLSQVAWARRDNTFSTEGGRISSRLVRSDSTIAQTLGLPGLNEETAVNYSTGLVWKPAGGWQAGLDWFTIEVDDRIILSDFLRDPALIEFIQQLPGGQGVQAIAAFTNAADTRTRGVELSGAFETRHHSGLWRLDSAYSRVASDVRRIKDTPDALRAISPQVQLVGIEEINTIETASPKHRWITTAQWHGGRWRAQARTRYFSSVVREFTFARQRFGSQWALDAEVGLSLGERWRLAAGASNLLDQYPDESAPANDFFGNFAFDPINPIGLNGRFVYLRLDWNSS